MNQVHSCPFSPDIYYNMILTPQTENIISLPATHGKADKHHFFQTGTPTQEYCIPSAGHPVATESTQGVSMVNHQHYHLEANPDRYTLCYSEAQHCDRICSSCDAPDGQWNDIHPRTGSWRLECQVDWVRWYALHLSPLYGWWVNQGGICCNKNTYSTIQMLNIRRCSFLSKIAMVRCCTRW